MDSRKILKNKISEKKFRKSIKNMMKIKKNNGKISDEYPSAKLKTSMIPRLVVTKRQKNNKNEVQENEKLCPASKSSEMSGTRNDRNGKLKILKSKQNCWLKCLNDGHTCINYEEKNKSETEHRGNFIGASAQKMLSDPHVFGKDISKMDSQMTGSFPGHGPKCSNLLGEMLNDSQRNITLNKQLNNKIDEELSKSFGIAKRSQSLILVKSNNALTDSKKTLVNVLKKNDEIQEFKSNPLEKVSECLVKNEDSESLKNFHELQDPSEIKLNSCSEQKIQDAVNSNENTEKPNNTSEFQETLHEKENGGENIAKYDFKEGKAVTDITQDEVNRWIVDLKKKKTTVINLRSKVLDLHKECNEYFFKCHDLQLKLSEFSKKRQEDLNLAEKNENSNCLELKSDPKENSYDGHDDWENFKFQIKELDAELKVIIKLNYLLFQRQSLLNKKFNENSEKIVEGDEPGLNNNADLVHNCDIAKGIVKEKQIAIEQLQMILQVMRNQESQARKQTCLFETKIQKHDQ